jgi:putative flavoprotein involved in K+ transport
MKRQMRKKVVVIGAGQAGLSVSCCLLKQGIDHVLLERRRLGESWRSQRWDTFRLVLPNWTVNLPEYPYAGTDPDGFMSREEIVRFLEDYSKKYSIPLIENAEVTELIQAGNGFKCETKEATFESDHVIVATGPFQKPSVPSFATQLPQSIAQMHSSDYRNPQQLKAGAVLVVGSGQSGAQIAEEIFENGRKVFLAVSHCSRVPRQFRGKDFAWWRAVPRGAWSEAVDNYPDPTAKFQCNSLLSGRNGGEEINLREYAQRGIVLLGRVESLVGEDTLKLAQDINSNLEYADMEYNQFLDNWRKYAKENNLQLPEEEEQHAIKSSPVPEPKEICLGQQQITNIIWSTGFRYDFSWIKAPVFDETGYPKHFRGFAMPGLYFLGLPWLHKRNSALLAGIAEDAIYTADQIKRNL